MEQRSHELETKQTELTTAIADPATYSQPGRAQELNAQLQATVAALQTATHEWEQAAQTLSEAENNSRS